MACRRELVEYDQQQRDAVATKGQVPTGAKPKTMITSDSKTSKTMIKEKKEW